jgi:hypothetical protein
MGYIEKDLMNEADRKLHGEVVELLDGVNSYDTLTLIMGVAGGYGLGVVSPVGITLEDYKVLAQSLLIESVKNDIIDDLNNPNIIKDKPFYERINAIMETIDSSIIYPNTETEFIRSHSMLLTKKEKVLDLRSHSVVRFAAKNPNMKNIVSFAELITMVGQSIEERKEGLKGIEDIMTFYQKQHDLDVKYDKLCNEQEEALKRMEEDRDRKKNNPSIEINRTNIF